MATKLSLRQIADIDNLPFYFKRADELDISDNNIIINFNNTGNTTSTSINAGITVQDGSGVENGDVVFEIRSLNNIDEDEYPNSVGYNNRGWVTPLNDIVLGISGGTNGFRVVKEKDFLDGGEF
jgi:hypothetical protein